MENKKGTIQEAAVKLHNLIDRLQAIDELIDNEFGDDFLGDILFDIAEEIYLISDEIKEFPVLPLTSLSNERLN